MRPGLTFLLLSACLTGLPAPAWAILIETGGKRVGGFLVSEDAKQISIRVRLPDGEEKLQVFERSKIKVLHKVDRNRLEKLTRENPADYREYAEELTDKKADPEATDLALRLFLIAAYLDPAKNGRDCLVSMSELAADSADARKYRAMAFLLDAKNDPALLKLEARKPMPLSVAEAKAARAALSYFRKALQQFREGKYKEAQANANVEGVATCFKNAPGTMDQKSFVQACKDAIFDKNLAEDHLDYVTRAEVWAIGQILADAPASERKAGRGGWFRALNNNEVSPVPTLRLETITEHDPRKCVYRNGDWKVP